MSTPIDPRDSAYDSIQPPFPKTRFRVFVLGPALSEKEVVPKPSSPPNNHEAVIEHARYLRSLTQLALSDEGYSVDFGETSELLKLWGSRFGAHDLGSAELLHARKVSGAIVIYPSSIGSISELGMFTPYDEIAEKLIAIVHKRYESDGSFFRKALLEVLKQEKGTSEFIDYGDHEACVKAAVEFVNGRYQKLLRDYINIDSAELKKAKYRGSIFEKHR